MSAIIMTTETKKRHRGYNFSTIERSIFVDILKKYISVIECKKTDGKNIRLKELAWGNLLEEFNSHVNVTKRNLKQLKSFYDNYKRKSKKQYANEKVEFMKTGGGTVSPILDDTSVKLLALIKKQNEPLAYKKDSDASFNENLNTPGTENTSQQSETESQILSNFTISDDYQSHITDTIECHVLNVVTDDVPFKDSQHWIETQSTEAVTQDQAVHVPAAQVVQSTPSQSSSCCSRNRPNLRRKQSKMCRESIASLVEEKKAVIRLECQLMKDRERKDDSLRDLKLLVQQKKLDAYELKRLYYERKLAKLNY